MDRTYELLRRNFVRLTGTAGVVGSLAGGDGAKRIADDVVAAMETQEDEDEQDDSSERIDAARRVSPRDFTEGRAYNNYSTLYDYRKRQAIETLLSDPQVNDVVSSFVGSFEAYDPLTEDLDAVSLQGSSDVTIEGGLEDGFEVTVTRQVAYGVIDRWTEELLAAHLTEPEEVTWQPWEPSDEGVRRLELITDDSRVRDHLEGNEWYPLFKVAESITGYRDYPHGDVSPSVLFVKEDDHDLVVVTAYLDVTDPDNMEVIDVERIERFVEHPPHELAESIGTREESVLDDLPDVPLEKRPWYSINDGYHRSPDVEESFEQDNWSIEWEPPGTHGIAISAEYNGKPVFDALEAPVTYTGYALPPREGRNIREWYFPEDNNVFTGHLLFWDIHSLDFGGPGLLGKIDYPETPDHASGFNMRTHYHTGATGLQSMDFHSGHRFGPYNYDISYEFFGDGVVRPIWRRQGPGFITEHLQHDHEGDRVVQHYTSAITMDVTPGTTDGTRVKIFDGNAWTCPEEEFYLEGETGMIARFTNPGGEETVDVPLDDAKELVVVRPHEDEFPRAQRVRDEDPEKEFYHPAQYVDGESIQGERVITWLLMEGAPGEVPHPAGITSFAVPGEVKLRNY